MSEVVDEVVVPYQEFKLAREKGEVQEEVTTEKVEEKQPVAEPAETAAESETAEAESKDKGEKKGGFQKRIDKLTRQNYEKDAELERLRAQLKQSGQTSATEEPNTATAKPTQDKFGTYEEFVEALADWKLEQKLKAKEEAQAKKSDEERMKSSFDSYIKKVAETAAQHEDFEELVGDLDKAMPPTLKAAIIEMENGPEVAYYLASNPEERDKLFDLNKKSQFFGVIQLGRISDKLTPKEESSPEKKPQTSSAPEPIKPVGGGSAKTATSLVELAESPGRYQDWKKAREQGRTR